MASTAWIFWPRSLRTCWISDPRWLRTCWISEPQVAAHLLESGLEIALYHDMRSEFLAECAGDAFGLLALHAGLP